MTIENVDNHFSSSPFKSSLQLTVGEGYSVTSIDGEKIILTGGSLSDDLLLLLATTFEGSLNEKEDGMNWTKLPSMKNARWYHAAFYVRKKLYVVGGASSSGSWYGSSEVYDVLKETWLDGPKLPYALCFPTAVNIPTQSFSIVFGEKFEKSGKRGIIIFDDVQGFREIASITFPGPSHVQVLNMD